MERPCVGPWVDSSRDDPRWKSASITRHMDEDPLWWCQAPSSQPQHFISGRSAKGLSHVLTNWSLPAVSAVVTRSILVTVFLLLFVMLPEIPHPCSAFPPLSFQSPCRRRMILKLLVLGNSKAGEGSVLGMKRPVSLILVTLCHLGSRAAQGDTKPLFISFTPALVAITSSIALTEYLLWGRTILTTSRILTYLTFRIAPWVLWFYFNRWRYWVGVISPGSLSLEVIEPGFKSRQFTQKSMLFFFF